jgi:hypothetical protein
VKDLAPEVRLFLSKVINKSASSSSSTSTSTPAVGGPLMRDAGYDALPRNYYDTPPYPGVRFAPISIAENSPF